MKKLLFASAIALGALCSCSNDEVVAPVTDNGVGEATGLVPVQLTLNKPSVVASVRGIGMVGGVQGGDVVNQWNGEDLYVFMMCKQNDDREAVFKPSAWSYKTSAEDKGTPRTNFVNAKLPAPKEVETGDLYSTTVEAYDESDPKFYPMDRSLHDFFAYHIDDAFVDEDNDNYPDVDSLTYTDRILVPFVIDGSQDLMAGKARPNDDANGNSDIAYSAASARAGVIPNIKMEHLLSRFTFEVEAGDNNANGLVVNKISVKSKTTGKIVAAYSTSLLAEGKEALEKEDLISFDEEVEKSFLDLKQKAEGSDKLVELSPLTLVYEDGVGEPLPIGESLMVASGEEEYELEVVTTQQMGELSNIFTHGTKIPVDGGALAGTSYKVRITLFGASEIKVQTTLEAWKDGGETIPVTPSGF